MHNVHYAVVKAISHAQAQDVVEAEIMDWGDENNWRTICGSVCEDGTAEGSGEGRWDPATMTIVGINAEIQNEILEDLTTSDPVFDLDIRATMQKLMEGKFKKCEYSELSALEQYVQSLISCRNSGVGPYTKKPFNVLKDSYKAHEYDQVGVTQMEFGKQRKTKRYVVVIDMHS